MAFVHKRNDGG